MKKLLMVVVGVLMGTVVHSEELKDGWMPKFYNGLEAVGSVQWVPKAFKEKIGAIRMVWESGAMKFGAAKEVTTELTGYVDWTITAWIKSEGDYGYAGAAMEFFDERGKSLGVVSSKRPSVAKEWRKIFWTFSAPKTAKRYVVHVLSLNKDPVMFAKVMVTSKQGVDKGDIPFEVAALPAEWNKDWNGGTVKMLSFSDAPLPISFYMKGEKKGRKDLQLVVDIPAELEIRDAYCPNAGFHEAFKPMAEPLVTNGIDYVRYTFANAAFYKRMDVGNYKVDEGLSYAMVIAPKVGIGASEKPHRIYYRTQLRGKRGEEKSMELSFRPLPTGLARAKDFPVFSWNNTDRHFASDAVANESLRAYEAAGLVSFRRTFNGGVSAPRQNELATLCEKRPVKYIFSGRFGDVWRLGACGFSSDRAKAMGVRMAVSSNVGYSECAKNKMCPEYFIKDAKLREHLREFVRGTLSASNVKDGDWVTFDMEPWHSSTWCHCDECHKAFAEFAGLDHVPTSDETQNDALCDKWAQFRCMHNEKSVELLVSLIREYNPTLQCVDYDYIMPYGDEEGMQKRRRACGKDTMVNEKWLDGHLCSYYHTIDKASFMAMKNDMRHLKKFYLPMAALAGYGGYLRAGEVLNPRQFRQFALAAFVNGCRGYAFYSGVCYDGEILMAMIEAQDEIAKWEGLPWGKVDGKTTAVSSNEQFVYASTVKPDGTEVMALFNYDSEDTVKAEVAGKTYELAPYSTMFVEIK